METPVMRDDRSLTYAAQHASHSQARLAGRGCLLPLAWLRARPKPLRCPSASTRAAAARMHQHHAASAQPCMLIK
jgi:hypothetical protein